MITNNSNIVFTGFMGTGKSTIGQYTAAKLRRDFIDTDQEISQQTSLSISAIFATQGEASFRTMEKKLCAWLGPQSNWVIATGGGMLVNYDNLKIMSENGLVICLHASLETLEQRLAHSLDRPLLQGNWKLLWREREKAYTVMPYHVDTTAKTPEEVAEEVIGLWENVSR